MIKLLRQAKEKLQRSVAAVRAIWLKIGGILREQFNKNIYTRILFTNTTVFIVALLVLIFFSAFAVQEITYDQMQQELLRKAKRVNYALMQNLGQAGEKETGEEETGREEEAGGEEPGLDIAAIREKQELLQYLADTFDARITIFNRSGKILATSAAQEVVPGSKVDDRFVALLNGEAAATLRAVDPATGSYNFSALVPMGNPDDSIEIGVLLETNSANLDLLLNKTRFYLAIGGAAMLVLIIIVSMYMAISIARPISRLSSTVAEISRGNYVITTADRPLDEINFLAGQINQLAERLQKIQSESSRMEEDKARLFAEISHELRTPLTAIQGFVEAIRDGVVQDEALQKRYLDTIYTQTVHISRLVDDLMILSRLESGSITVEKLPVDLTALAKGVVTSMEAEARKRKNVIRLARKTESAMVLGDVDRMEQVLRNLLKNAILATENGTIGVAVESREDEVVLTITDNGIGISPEDLPHIWDRFYRVKNFSRHGQEKGSGLGLVIVKKLVQLQGGKISVASELGKGTVFNITFPCFKKS